MAATGTKKGRFSWQYAFALLFLAFAVAAFILRPEPWLLLPLLGIAGFLALVGRRARKIGGGIDVPLPSGSSATAHVDAVFGDQKAEEVP